MKKLLIFLCLISSVSFAQNNRQKLITWFQADSLDHAATAGTVTLIGDVTGSAVGTIPTTVGKLLGVTIPALSNGVLTYTGGVFSWAAAAGGGTVTTVSVVTANGFAGTVANPTTTPAITISSTVNGIVKSNGTTQSAATAGTDYLDPATGIKNAAANTLTGITTITSNAANQIILNGSYTAGANNDFYVNSTGTKTSRNTASDVLVDWLYNSTLTLNAGSPSSVRLISLRNTPIFSGTNGTTQAVLAENSSTLNSFLLYELRNLSSGSSADIRLRLGNDASAFQAQLIVNSSANTSLGGASSTNLITTSTTPLTLGTNGTVRYTLSAQGNNTYTQSAQAVNHALMTLTQAAHTGGVPIVMVQTGAILTGLTAGTEVASITYNFAQSKTWASNTTVALQRSIVLGGNSTLSHTTAGGNFTVAVNTDVSGSPIAGSNTTIGTSIGLRITGNNVTSNTTLSYGLFVEPNTGATTNYAIGTSGNLAMTTAGNKIFIKEGSNGSVGQTTLVAGTKAITITGLTTSSRAFPGFVSPGGTVTTTWQYKFVCTANTLTITAIDNTGATNTLDTSVLNYFIIEPTP